MSIELRDEIVACTDRLFLVRSLLLNRHDFEASDRYLISTGFEGELLSLCQEQIDMICDRLHDLPFAEDEKK